MVKLKADLTAAGQLETVSARTGSSKLTGNPPMATVTSVREVALDLQPSLHEDLDQLIEQLRELSDEYLRTVGSDPEGTCSAIGVVTGQVGWVTIAELAKGTLDDRHRNDAKGFKLWHLLVTSALTVIGMLIVFAITGK